MEKNEISKQIKKKLVQNGLGFIHVKGGTGTAWGWININSDRDLTETEKEMFFKLFGIEIGRQGDWVARLDEWESALGFSESKDLINSESYQKLRQKYYETAQKLPDSGTCCGGSGTFILKEGKKIDFWKNNFAQSDDPVCIVERELNQDFQSLGLTTEHEAGWMD